MGSAAGQVAEPTATDRVMERALKTALAGNPAYPNGAVFVPAGLHDLGRVLGARLEEGAPVVLVFDDGGTALVTTYPPAPAKQATDEPEPAKEATAEPPPPADLVAALRASVRSVAEEVRRRLP